MTVAELPKEGSRNLGPKSWPDGAGRGDSASSTLELLCCRKYLLTALGANNIEREREREREESRKGAPEKRQRRLCKLLAAADTVRIGGQRLDMSTKW